MPIRELAVEGYRSIRRMRLELGQINVLTGPNGCGKSNLYNAVFLIAKAAAGGFAQAIAEEGGMPSVLWAGVQKRFTRRAPPRRVKLAVTVDEFRYEMQFGLPDCGPPQIEPSMFKLDPRIKEESISLAGARGRTICLMNRTGASASVRNTDGAMVDYPMSLSLAEPILAQVQEPHLYPELSSLRGAMMRWRFYHHFRTDPESRLRHPRVGVLTPVLSHDGADLAAAIQTIVEIGDAEGLREAVDRAFPGARLEICSEATQFAILMHMPGILRPLAAAELSDGTLRYLCLMTALLSPRPPTLLALNEPETSIHPDLIEPLAALILRASRDSQLWITTHSRALADRIERQSGQRAVRLRMREGETELDSEGELQPRP